MTRYLCAAVTLGLISVTIPLRATDRPHAGKDLQNRVVWTNDDLDKLHDLGLISIVGREDDEEPASAPPAPYLRTQGPAWYATQAANLGDEIKYNQAQLREYQQAMDNARSLGESTGGIDLVDEGFAITPDAGIGILRQHGSETQIGARRTGGPSLP